MQERKKMERNEAVLSGFCSHLRIFLLLPHIGKEISFVKCIQIHTLTHLMLDGMYERGNVGAKSKNKKEIAEKSITIFCLFSFLIRNYSKYFFGIWKFEKEREKSRTPGHYTGTKQSKNEIVYIRRMEEDRKSTLAVSLSFLELFSRWYWLELLVTFSFWCVFQTETFSECAMWKTPLLRLEIKETKRRK